MALDNLSRLISTAAGLPPTSGRGPGYCLAPGAGHQRSPQRRRPACQRAPRGGDRGARRVAASPARARWSGWSASRAAARRSPAGPRSGAARRLPDRPWLDLFDGPRPDRRFAARTWEAIHGSQVGAVFQDPAVVPEPVAHRRAPARRGAAGEDGHVPPSRPPARHRAFRRGGPASAGARVPPDPGRAVRRHAPAGHGRHRDLLRPRAAHSRRGDHGPGRDHPGRGPRPAAPSCATNGLAVLFVSHDLAVVAELCDRIVVFYAGRGGRVRARPRRSCERPRHPYTQALLEVASGRRLPPPRSSKSSRASRRPVGSGHAGCRFAGRCRFAIDPCRAGPIVRSRVGDQHEVRCVPGRRAATWYRRTVGR